MDSKADNANNPTTNQPLISVVMPLYESESFLDKSIGSILGQTISNWELICVDDGSCDGTVAYVENLAAQDPRIKLLQLPHKGPGFARNQGIKHARGKYLYCMDSDDFIENTLFEKSVARAEELNADIVMWDLWFYNHREQRKQYPSAGILNFAAFDNEQHVFSWRDNPDQIFLGFQTWCWNKLFKMDFIRNEHLAFDEDIFRSEDIRFVYPALIKAKRMTAIPERLVYYRVARESSAMATKDSRALEFLKAIVDFKQTLENDGVFPSVERSYVSWAASSTLYNLRTLKTSDAFCKVFETLKESGLEQMGLLGFDTNYFLNAWVAEELKHIESDSLADYLHHCYRAEDANRERFETLLEFERIDREFEKREFERRASEFEKRVSEFEKEQAQLRHEIASILDSRNYRLGARLLKVPRAAKKKLLACRSMFSKADS